jgi:hypothetical protein
MSRLSEVLSDEETTAILNLNDGDGYQRTIMYINGGEFNVDYGYSKDSKYKESVDRDIPGYWNSTEEITIYGVTDANGESVDYDLETLIQFICQRIS